MYSYFFLVSLIKCDENFEYMAEKIGYEYMKIIRSNFPKIGIEDSSNTLGFGVGEQPNLIIDLQYFSSLFPNCVLAYYHFHWNCKYLTIYTISDKVYIDKHDLENFKVGPYNISSSYNIKHTQIPNNITNYLNINYQDPKDQYFI